jgi:hypothetical protein
MTVLLRASSFVPIFIYELVVWDWKRADPILTGVGWVGFSLCSLIPNGQTVNSEFFSENGRGGIGKELGKRPVAGRLVILRGPLAGLFQVLLHWLLQKPCQTPDKIMASKLKSWRSHFAICTMEVKPKIVASRGFFPHVS